MSLYTILFEALKVKLHAVISFINSYFAINASSKSNIELSFSFDRESYFQITKIGGFLENQLSSKAFHSSSARLI